MKILFVANVSNFEGIGGIEYHLLDLSRSFSQNGCEIAFAVRKNTSLEKELRKKGLTVYPLEWTGVEKPVGLIQLFRSIIHFSPDIISINREKDIDRVNLILPLARGFLKSAPITVGVFHMITDKKIYTFRRLNGIITVSEVILRNLSKKNPTLQILHSVIPNGINVPCDFSLAEKFSTPRKRRFFSNTNSPLIGMVGELRKNQEELVEVASHLRLAVPDFKIVVAGRGSPEYIRKIKEKIRKYSLENHFIFTGHVEREKIFDLFFDLDLSVSTFRSEGFGIVHLESLASYTPVVAYNEGGHVELIRRGGGVLVEGGAEDLAQVLATLLNSQEKRKSLAIEGRKLVETEYHIDKISGDHLDFYRKILHNRET